MCERINEGNILKNKLVVSAISLIVVAMVIFACYFIVLSAFKISDKSCKIFLRGDAVYEVVLNSSGEVANIEVYNEKGAIYVAKENFATKTLYEAIEEIAMLKNSLKLSNADNVLVLNLAFSSDYVYKMVKDRLGNFVNAMAEKYNEVITIKGFSISDYNTVFSAEKSTELNSKQYIEHYEKVLTSELKVAVENKLSNVNSLIGILTPYAESGNNSKIDSEDFNNVITNLEDFCVNYNYDLSEYDINGLTYNDVYDIVINLNAMQNDLEVQLNGLEENYNLNNYKEFAYSVKKLLIQAVGE